MVSVGSPECCPTMARYLEFCEHLGSFFERDPKIIGSVVKYSMMEIKQVHRDGPVEKCVPKVESVQNRLLSVTKAMNLFLKD